MNHEFEDADPTIYLRDHCAASELIDVSDIAIHEGQAHTFPIEQLFGPLYARWIYDWHGVDLHATDGGKRIIGTQTAYPPSFPVNDVLRRDRLVVMGEPGAGKTTLIRWLVHAMCEMQLGTVADAAQNRLGFTDRTFPIPIRISELAEFLATRVQDLDASSREEDVKCFASYLATANAANGWKLPADFFVRHLENGRCTVLLDGMDETPDERVQARVSRLIANLTETCPGCRFVVTTRVRAYSRNSVLTDFEHICLVPFSQVERPFDNPVGTYLSKWFQALCPESESSDARQKEADKLLAALADLRHIERLDESPLMLTALVVAHFAGLHLPEQRADLYDVLIRWLLRSRDQRCGRGITERIVVLQELALAMQTHPDGVQETVSRRWGTEQVAAELASGPGDDSADRIESLLRDEELESGILRRSGRDVEFVQRSFREYLAARAIVARPEREQRQVLWPRPARFYLPEWKEVVLLLTKLLHGQNSHKVCQLLGTALDELGEKPGLAEQARCVGLIGAVLRDLSPAGYELTNPRYAVMLHHVTGIFDKDRCQDVPVQDRIAAADTLCKQTVLELTLTPMTIGSSSQRADSQRPWREPWPGDPS